MRSTADSPSCSQAPRKRLLLVGGFTVPAIVLGSLLGAAPAIAVGPTVTKADITTAFGAATSTNTTVQLTGSLTDPAADGTSDVQTLAGGKSLTIDLAGRTLDLDQIRIAAGSTLTVEDTTGGGALQLGSTPLTAGDSTGVTLSPGAHLVVTQDASVTSTGSGSLPGVGTTAASGSAATVTVSDGASLTAMGGTGAAGLGGTVPTTVSVDDATLSATGGAGAAGIGGSIGKAGSAVTLNHGALVTAHDGATSGQSTPAASAIGNGQGSTAFGSLSIADSASVLTVPAGATLGLPAAATVDNEGKIDVLGSLSGAGSITNNGTIVPSGSGTVAPDLQVTGNDYAVTLDAGTSGTVTPTTARVLADTFAHGSVALPDAVADSAHYFNAWKSSSTTVGSTTALSTVAGTAAANGAQPVSLTADYDTQLSFTQSTDLGLLNTTTAVSTQLLASGSGTKTWSQPTSGLPAGLALDSTGLLSGTPTATGSFSFTTTVTGPHGTANRTYTGSVGVVPVMADATLANGTVGSHYSQTISATSGTDGTTYTAPTGSLPDGLTLGSDGTVTGTPTAAAGGSKTFTVTATNSYGTSHADYTILTHTIPVFTTTTLPSAVLGTSYSKQLATSGDGTITYALSSSTPLPGSMTVSSTGLISGIATRAGSRTITVVATSEYGTTSQNYVFVAGDVPAITTASLPSTTTGVAYSQQLTTTGDGTVTWSQTGLNNGLSLSSSGLLTGTVTSAGSDTFTVTSTSSFGTVDKDFTIVAGSKPSISTTSIGDPIEGVSYTDAVAATGTGTTSYSATGLPAGLSIDGTTGAITGTPTASGAFTAHVTATNSWGSTTADFPITVHLVPGWVTAATLPDVSTTTDVDQQLSAPGDGTTTYAAIGALPGTLALSTAGHLTGTVPEGPSTFTVRATNSYGHLDQTFSITAGVAPTITTASGDLAAPVLGASGYSATIVATGDDDPTFSVTGGALPDGLHLNGTTGAITGTATTPGAFSFVVTATSHWGTSTQTFTGLVGAVPTFLSTTLPGATFGAHYDQLVGATVAGSGVTYSVSSGTLPDGLHLHPHSAHIVGDLADDAVASTFTITVHTTYGDAQQQYTITPGHAPTITTTTLATAAAGRSYSSTIVGTGDGVGYAVTAGELPDGLTLGTDGSITGTPTTTGTASFTVTATSEFGSVDQAYDLTVASAPSFTTTSLGQAIVGMPFLKAIGTAGDDAIALHVQGALPAGITFDSTSGVLSGTPTAAGTATVTIVAVSDLGTTSHDYTFSAFAAPALATTALASGTAGSAYSTTVHATGSGDVAYTVTSGSLPTGLTLNGRTGAVTGTPTTAGTATFTVTATSAYGTDSKSLTLTVAAAPVVAPPAAPSLPVAPKATAELGHGFALSVAADSTLPVTYSVKGALPKGVALNARTGLISGTAKESGTFAFSVTAKSSAGSDTQKYTVVVPDLVVLVHGSANWITPIQGQPFTVSISGLQRGEHWTVEANGTTVRTGTAAKAGTVTTSVTLKKALGDRSYTIRVSGSRTVTDPAKTASDEFTVTAITARKTLKVQRSGSLIKVVNLAPREIVALKIDGTTVASGRADTKGLFVSTAKSWSKGTHTVTVVGKTTTRTGKLTVKITK